MEGWKARLHADPLLWLREEENPSVRYFALRDLEGLPEDDEELSRAKAAIMTSGPVPRILSKQAPGGHWGNPADFYVRSKYKGTVWNLILLAELGAEGEDERIRRAGEFVLRWSQHRESGGFSHNGTGEKGGTRGGVISCLTGNMTFSLHRLGFAEDERVQKAYDWIVRYQRYEAASTVPEEWPYLTSRCWSSHTCRSGAVKALKAMAEVPSSERTPAMRKSIAQGAEFILQQLSPQGLHLRNEWLNFGFPLMWNTDVLEMLSLLANLGQRDERMRPMLDLVVSKQNQRGRWLQENRFEGRFAARFESNGKESKWVTLNALRLLKALDI